jgi:adenine-specific DNA methylase
MDKRLIEVTFPVKEVSAISAKEKNIRHGHISTLHIWWARRPLAASRATAYAALIPAPESEKELEEEKKFIAEFSKWENTNNPVYIEKARRKILKAYGGKPPKVLDPFGGGGSIPLECLRLGCETYSNDLNPVAVLIQKCTLEYPQKYGKLISKEKYLSSRNWFINSDILISDGTLVNPLIEDINYLGNLIVDELHQEYGKYYPKDSSNSSPVGYIWAKTIKCQNPSCGAEIPLLGQYWLVKKDNKKVSLFPYIYKKDVKFKIVGTGYENFPEDFEPNEATVSRSIVTCLVCKSTIDAKTTRKIFQKKENSERLIAVINHFTNKSGKEYRLANQNDIIIFNEAKQNLQLLVTELEKKWGMEPLPNEELPLMSGVFNVPIYGINKWHQLYNYRQKLILLALADKIKSICDNKFDNFEKDYLVALLSYLSFAFDKVNDYCNVLCQWRNNLEAVGHTFAKQALPMLWDYVEGNPISGASGTFLGALEWISMVLKKLSNSSTPATINQMNASKLDFPDEYFDAIFTDPPYYNSVPYADLSDFFYVWLKRIIGDYYPLYFSTPQSPKKDEITQMNGWDPIRYPNKDKNFFEENLFQSFKEISRTLKNNGTAIIVYAHKTTEGWETLINSLLDSKLVVTGAWPLDTELAVRLRAQSSAALASSIYIIIRKFEKLPTNFYQEVKEELKSHLNPRLDHLWNEGISGPDFFIAAIGSSLEVYSKYKKVMDFEGREIRADKFLQDVRTIVTDYAVRKILHNGFAGEISDLTRFYILFRWEFGTLKVEFDEANKLAHSCHVDLADEWTKKSSFIKKEKEFISILGPQDRDIDDLEESSELIDVLHLSLKYWEKNRKKELNDLLRTSGFGRSDAFYRVAQAIAETLPQDNKEKKLLEGFLNLREKIISTVSEAKTKDDQGKLEFPENDE